MRSFLECLNLGLAPSRVKVWKKTDGDRKGVNVNRATADTALRCIGTSEDLAADVVDTDRSLAKRGITGAFPPTVKLGLAYWHVTSHTSFYTPLLDSFLHIYMASIIDYSYFASDIAVP